MPAGRGDGSLVIEVEDESFTPAFLARFGSSLEQVGFEKPSLESVFLALTGRELRDRAADERERQGAAGKRSRRS